MSVWACDCNAITYFSEIQVSGTFIMVTSLIHSLAPSVVGDAWTNILGLPSNISYYRPGVSFHVNGHFLCSD